MSGRAALALATLLLGGCSGDKPTPQPSAAGVDEQRAVGEAEAMIGPSEAGSAAAPD